MSEPPNSRPNPDPTIATNEAVERAMKSERDYVDGQVKVLEERLAGIDKATELLQVNQDRIPEHVQKVVGHLKELVEEKFESVATQFSERDTRSERESRDNKTAVDAAFAAQKEAATKQDESNAKAIDKSEVATAEKIDKLSELFRTEIRGLTTGLADLKERVSGAESSRHGVREATTERRESLAGIYALVGAVAGGLGIIGILAASGVFS